MKDDVAVEAIQLWCECKIAEELDELRQIAAETNDNSEMLQSPGFWYSRAVLETLAELRLFLMEDDFHG